MGSLPQTKFTKIWFGTSWLLLVGTTTSNHSGPPALGRLKRKKASRTLERMCWPPAARDADTGSAHPAVFPRLCSGSERCAGGPSTWALHLGPPQRGSRHGARCSQTQDGWQHHQEVGLGHTADWYCSAFYSQAAQLASLQEVLVSMRFMTAFL